ncbi:MAG: dephospho-CoA kinase [Deltaproteobacteria bacterium]|nr:dephospho-CoA kinase [Deltaproteobacteria bacterium]
MLLAGLTGGAASGKSLVHAEFERLGAHVIDADAAAREIVVPGSPALAEITARFGPGILNADGTLDRRGLGRIVFSDPGARAALNAITHPRIRARINERMEELKKLPESRIIIIVDAALLIENGLAGAMDMVIVVDAAEETLVERIMKRDGLTRPEAKSRIAAQMPLAEKRAKADYVIDNNGTPEEAIEQTARIYARLVSGAGSGRGGNPLPPLVRPKAG